MQMKPLSFESWRPNLSGIIPTLYCISSSYGMSNCVVTVVELPGKRSITDNSSIISEQPYPTNIASYFS